jgi:fructose/tagatose bisphosphate aldolase
VDLCKAATDAGCTNVMIDASRENFEKNVRQTTTAADRCHSLGGI